MEDKERENMAEKIVPTEDHVVIIRDLGAQKTKGGIIIPDSARERLRRGVILAVGPGRYQDGKLIEPRVIAGEKVLFSDDVVDEIKIDGKDHVIVREGSIVATLGE
jgi:chaperonin GroES